MFNKGAVIYWDYVFIVVKSFPNGDLWLVDDHANNIHYENVKNFSKLTKYEDNYEGHEAFNNRRKTMTAFYVDVTTPDHIYCDEVPDNFPYDVVLEAVLGKHDHRFIYDIS